MKFSLPVLLLPLLLNACATPQTVEPVAIAPPPVAAAPAPAATADPTPAAAPVAATTTPPPTPVAAPAAVTPAKPETSATKSPETKPAPNPPAKTTAPARTPAPATPPKAAAAAAAPAVPSMALATLEQRLKDTDAIGVFTKIALKNQVDDLLNRAKTHHQNNSPSLAQLRQSYDQLLTKVLGLLKDGDPALANAIVASRETLWTVLTDPVKFAKL